MSASGVPVTTADGYAALRSTAAVHVRARDVLSVSGADAVPYLQGQCSQDLAGLGPGRSTESLLLSPQGKVDAYIRLTGRDDGSFILDTDAGWGPVVTARLERFRLRMKVEITALDWICVAVRGPGSAAGIIGRPELSVAVEWPGWSGVDLLGPAPVGAAEGSASGVDQWVDAGVVRCGDGAWEAARIEAGVPIAGHEEVEGAIPAELGLVDRTVSFTKGCFTGQELVARIDSRGSNVPRRLAGVIIPADPGPVAGGPGTSSPETGLPPVGATVLTADGNHEVGRLSSVAWSPGWEGAVALALLHRRVTPPEDVLVRWDPDRGPGTAPGAAPGAPPDPSPDPVGGAGTGSTSRVGRSRPLPLTPPTGPV